MKKGTNEGIQEKKTNEQEAKEVAKHRENKKNQEQLKQPSRENNKAVPMEDAQTENNSTENNTHDENHSQPEYQNNKLSGPYIAKWLPPSLTEPRQGEITHIVIHFSSNPFHKPEDPFNVDDLYRVFLKLVFLPITSSTGKVRSINWLRKNLPPGMREKEVYRAFLNIPID